jgi:hypothetical protein
MAYVNVKMTDELKDKIKVLAIKHKVRLPEMAMKLLIEALRVKRVS